eukprot:CAMPEP_0194313770 /NCGR_PEP_ID=MMETSP0171-20130528/10624_1 /TAXON_ID=218684 /ORGANISM="Corethron pennatum, Strain L29A3" /LENGTH=649 /DNA_ID=CAMNT_0039068875 /DNA_START=135 /DNA_END=2086 /DNA_ORIENTATION=+
MTILLHTYPRILYKLFSLAASLQARKEGKDLGANFYISLLDRSHQPESLQTSDPAERDVRLRVLERGADVEQRPREGRTLALVDRRRPRQPEGHLRPDEAPPATLRVGPRRLDGRNGDGRPAVEPDERQTGASVRGSADFDDDPPGAVHQVPFEILVSRQHHLRPDLQGNLVRHLLAQALRHLLFDGDQRSRRHRNFPDVRGFTDNRFPLQLGQTRLVLRVYVPVDTVKASRNDAICWEGVAISDDTPCIEISEFTRGQSADPHLVEQVNECGALLPLDVFQHDDIVHEFIPHGRVEGERPPRPALSGYRRKLEKVAEENNPHPAEGQVSELAFFSNRPCDPVERLQELRRQHAALIDNKDVLVDAPHRIRAPSYPPDHGRQGSGAQPDPEVPVERASAHVDRGDPRRGAHRDARLLAAQFLDEEPEQVRLAGARRAGHERAASFRPEDQVGGPSLLRGEGLPGDRLRAAGRGGRRQRGGVGADAGVGRHDGEDVGPVICRFFGSDSFHGQQLIDGRGKKRVYSFQGGVWEDSVRGLRFGLLRPVVLQILSKLRLSQLLRFRGRGLILRNHLLRHHLVVALAVRREPPDSIICYSTKLRRQTVPFSVDRRRRSQTTGRMGDEAGAERRRFAAAAPRKHLGWEKIERPAV